MKTVVTHLRKLALLQEGHTLTDAQLLEAFVTRRDEAAFELLLRRHGPMVLGVCRRLLGNIHDAEDAFQATFLVFARKAASIRPASLVGPWLHGVAQRTAMKARTMAIKRRIRERNAQPSPAGEPPQELLEQLDVEVNRLPEKYRVPVILCELEGKTRKEAARLLGLSEGTLSWRLAQARKMLARRLAPYAGNLSVAAVLALAQGTTAAPFTLLKSTANAAHLSAPQALQTGLVSTQVVLLTEGVLRTMFLSKLKVIGVVLALVVGTSSLGVHYGAAAEPKKVRTDELEELRLEIAALRSGMQALRERVRVLESQRDTAALAKEKDKLNYQLRKSAADALRVTQGTKDTATSGKEKDELKLSSQLMKSAAEPLHLTTAQELYFLTDRNWQAEADAAFKKLRENPDDKNAAANLVEALKKLKEREKQKPPAASTPKQ